jgi:hypothetical protein
LIAAANAQTVKASRRRGAEQAAMKVRTVLVGLVFSGAAVAAYDLDFSAVDLNGDAAVDPRELAASGLFELRDFDDNGAISSDQLGNERLFELWDTNDDGNIRPDEFYPGIIAYADADGNELLGPVEFERTLIDWEAGAPVERLQK